MNEQLSHWVIGCECVADTDEALRVLREAARTDNSYQIAILDHHLPVMNGEMLGQSIKKIPDLKDTVLVMLTSVGQRGEAARFKEIGFSACLVKPVRRLQLKEILSTVWGGVQQRLNSPMVKRHTLAESTSDGQGNSTCRDTGHVAHVLAADDNIVNNKVASRNLEKLGCKVELVDNGQEALDAVMKNSYDLVFMDARNRLIVLQHAANDRDYGQLHVTAHAMKGASLNIGAERMTDVCMRLEEYSEDKSNIEALFLVKLVDEELEQIIEVYPGLLKSQTGS
jgi:CheY-like chemotaxis protein